MGHVNELYGANLENEDDLEVLQETHRDYDECDRL